MNKKNQVRIVKILFAAAFIELMIILAFSFFKEEAVLNPEFELSGLNIDSTLTAIFAEFEFDDTYVKKISRGKFSGDSLLFNYRIELPQDISLLEFLEYIYEVFPHEKIVFETRESVINKKMSIGFYSGGYLKVVAEVEHNQKRIRQAFDISLLIEDAELTDSSKFYSLLKEPEKFTVLLEPSGHVIKMAHDIISARKNYELILNMNIEELKYRIDNGYSEKRLRATAANLRNDFPGKEIIIADEEISNNKSFFKKLKKYFKEVKFELIAITQLVKYSNYSQQTKSQKLQELVAAANERGFLNLRFGSDSIFEIKILLRKMKMKGVKTIFYNPALEKSR